MKVSVDQETGEILSNVEMVTNRQVAGNNNDLADVALFYSDPQKLVDKSAFRLAILF